MGFVEVFDPNGFLLQRIAPRGPLNAPWCFAAQPVNTLYFTAGPGDEEHGLYGRISAKASFNYDARLDREDY